MKSEPVESQLLPRRDPESEPAGWEIGEARLAIGWLAGGAGFPTPAIKLERAAGGMAGALDPCPTSCPKSLTIAPGEAVTALNAFEI